MLDRGGQKTCVDTSIWDLRYSQPTVARHKNYVWGASNEPTARNPSARKNVGRDTYIVLPWARRAPYTTRPDNAGTSKDAKCARVRLASIFAINALASFIRFLRAAKDALGASTPFSKWTAFSHHSG